MAALNSPKPVPLDADKYDPVRTADEGNIGFWITFSVAMVLIVGSLIYSLAT